VLHELLLTFTFFELALCIDCCLIGSLEGMALTFITDYSFKF
jgi:hypothetical protein